MSNPQPDALQRLEQLRGTVNARAQSHGISCERAQNDGRNFSATGNAYSVDALTLVLHEIDAIIAELRAEPVAERADTSTASLDARLTLAFVWCKGIEHGERLYPSSVVSNAREHCAREAAQAIEDAVLYLRSISEVTK